MNALPPDAPKHKRVLLSSETWNLILAEIRRTTPKAGSNISLDITSTGTTISATLPPGGGSSGSGSSDNGGPPEPLWDCRWLAKTSESAAMFQLQLKFGPMLAPFVFEVMMQQCNLVPSDSPSSSSSSSGSGGGSGSGSSSPPYDPSHSDDDSSHSSDGSGSSGSGSDGSGGSGSGSGGSGDGSGDGSGSGDSKAATIRLPDGRHIAWVCVEAPQGLFRDTLTIPLRRRRKTADYYGTHQVAREMLHSIIPGTLHIAAPPYIDSPEPMAATAKLSQSGQLKITAAGGPSGPNSRKEITATIQVQGTRLGSPERWRKVTPQQAAQNRRHWEKAWKP